MYLFQLKIIYLIISASYPEFLKVFLSVQFEIRREEMIFSIKSEKNICYYI